MLFRSSWAKSGEAVWLANWARIGSLSGRPYRLDERLHPEDGDHPLEIVGEDVKAHFRSHLFERAGQEVGRPIHALMVPNGCSAVWRRWRA